MLLEIGIGLIVGIVVGWGIAWMLGQSRQVEERQRAAQQAEELVQRTAALEAAQRDRELTRQEQTARDAAHNERDARQREEIARLTADRAHMDQDADRAATAIEELRAENNRMRNELSALQTERASLQATLEAEHGRACRRVTDKDRIDLSNHFKAGWLMTFWKKNPNASLEQEPGESRPSPESAQRKFGEFQQESRESGEGQRSRSGSELKVQIEQLRTPSTKGSP